MKENHDIEVGNIEITFHLPDWLDDDDFTYRVTRYGLQGEYQSSEDHNHATNEVLDIEGAEECCIYPGSCWVKISVESEKEINRVKKEIGAKLDLLKEKLATIKKEKAEELEKEMAEIDPKFR